MFPHALPAQPTLRTKHHQCGFLRVDVIGPLILALLIGTFFACAERQLPCDRDAVSVHNTQRDCAGPLHVDLRP